MPDAADPPAGDAGRPKVPAALSVAQDVLPGAAADAPPAPPLGPDRRKPVRRPRPAPAEPVEQAISPDLAGAFSQALVEHAPNGVYFVDRNRRILFWNRGAEEISGFGPGAVVGSYCYANILNHVDGAGHVLCHARCPLVAAMETGRASDADVWLRHRRGYRKPVRVRAIPVRDAAGQVVGAVESFVDTTELSVVRADAAWYRQAAHVDPLTQLPNRRALESEMASRSAALASDDRGFGILIVDVDHFKTLNDTAGHQAGDAMLKVVAQSLSGALRAGDMVGRWGGDEFVALVSTEAIEVIRATAERLRALVEQSTAFSDGIEYRATVSVGGAQARPGDGPEAVFARADRALYRVKESQRNRIALLEDLEAPEAEAL